MELDGMTREQLLTEAKNLELTGLSQKDKPTIRLAVEAELTAREAEALSRREQGLPAEEEAPPEMMEGEPLTTEQMDKLRASSVGDIQKALENQAFPRQWRIAFQKELDTRTAAAAAAAEKERMTSPMQAYEITKGGPFIIRGRVTKIHTGGVVYETTHNLEDLKRQGIEFEPLKGHVEVVRGALGFPTTKIVRD